jgi:multicomponent Na+:H+ antiporter subunit G
MDQMIDILSWGLLLTGVVFCLIGALGIIRLPDMFARMHGAGIIDTLGIGLIFLGLMLQAGFNLVLVKLVLILVFIMFTSPTATHALARAALRGGVEPRLIEGPPSQPADAKIDEEGSVSKT